MSTVDVFAIVFMAFIGGFLMSMQIQVYVINREILMMRKVMNVIRPEQP